MSGTHHVLLASAKGNCCSSFGSQQDHLSKDGAFIIITCGETGGDFETDHPDMAEHIPASYPSWITAHCVDPLNATYAEALSLVRDMKPANQNSWSPLLENGVEVQS